LTRSTDLINMFLALSPNLLVNDIEQSLAFYQNLGFEKINQVPENGKPQWAMLRGGTVGLMLQDKKSAVADLPFRYSHGENAGILLYFDVESVEEIRLRADGKAQIIKEIHSTFYGTNELVVADPDHNLLVFAEDKK
jgi:uncharacterized glyoxalase superfamily protein PhnB